jgi:hypothetical protein
MEILTDFNSEIEYSIGKVCFYAVQSQAVSREAANTNAWGYNWTTLFLEERNTGTTRLEDSQI